MIRILAIAVFALLTFTLSSLIHTDIWSNVAPDPADAIATCIDELSERDQTMFLWAANMFDLWEREHDALWTENFRLDHEPIMMLSANAQFEVTHGYLFNHDYPELIENICRVELPNYPNLGDVYRLDPLPESITAQEPGFAFEYWFAGENMYAFNYIETGLLAAPVSWDWVLFIGHEGLHRNQFIHWEQIESPIEPPEYRVDRENLAHILLEHKLLYEAYMTDNPAIRDQAMLEFAAVRDFRLENWEQTQLDQRQEQIEGMARYVEYKIIDLTNFEDPRLIDNSVFLPLWTYEQLLGDPSGFLGFGRFYISGSALGLILDDMGLDWKLRVERGESPSEVLLDHFTSELHDRDALINAAKSRHDFKKLHELAGKSLSDTNPVESNPNFPYPYEPTEDLPEVDLSFLRDLPTANLFKGMYRLPLEAIAPEERPFYSPNGEQVYVVVVTGRFNSNTRIHVSQTEYPSTRDWYEDVVQNSTRIPYLQMITIDGMEIAFSNGIVGSFIVIDNGRFIHITGVSSFNHKLEIARAILGSE